MVIGAIIFDLGGVLLRTVDLKPRQRLASRLGMSRLELEEMIFDRDSGNRAQKGEITARQHWENLRRQLGYSTDELKNLLDEFFGQDELDVAMLDYIRELHQIYKTGLLSNAWDAIRQAISRDWHMEDAFDSIILSSEVGLLKPDPVIFHLAIERLGVQANQTIFVDDMLRNVEGAKIAGLLGVHFQNSLQMRADLERIINSCSE